MYVPESLLSELDIDNVLLVASNAIKLATGLVDKA